MQKQNASNCNWSMKTLERATAIGQRTLARAAERTVEWPEQTWKNVPKDSPMPYTTLDEAFDTVLKFMSMTTRQCKNYHESNPPREHELAAVCHCRRFHTPARYAAAQHKHPLQSRRDVHMVVPRGSYTVSAHPWRGQVETTTVVDVQPGEDVDIDYIV